MRIFVIPGMGVLSPDGNAAASRKNGAAEGLDAVANGAEHAHPSNHNSSHGHHYNGWPQQNPDTKGFVCPSASTSRCHSAARNAATATSRPASSRAKSMRATWKLC